LGGLHFVSYYRNTHRIGLIPGCLSVFSFSFLQV